MVFFNFKSEGHFVASSDRNALKVYELAHTTIHPSYIRKTHWKEVATICPRNDDNSNVDYEDESVDDGDDINAYTREDQSSYDGLMFFDGHGKIQGWEALTKLAQHLTRLQLMVSPQGQCYQNVIELREYRDFGIHYLRLNDLFNWPNYGVAMASISTWQRLVLKCTVPRHEGNRSTTGGVSEEKHELEMLRKEKDDELKTLKEEVENLRRANKEDEAGGASKVREEKDVETQKLKDQLSHLHELEQRREQQWVLRTGARLSRIVQRRQPVASDTFFSAAYSNHYCYESQATSWPFPFANLEKVDEEPKDWPPPPRILVGCYPGEFDKNNWWFVKTVHSNGGLTMVAYYDGNQTCFTENIHNFTIHIPFPRNSKVWASTPFFLFCVDSAYRLAFTYRD